jgi:hypothetical protein
MSNGMYEAFAVLPASSDFTLDRAVRHFASLSFNQLACGDAIVKNEPVRAELAILVGKQEPSGFKVYYGNWAVAAWLDMGEDVLQDSRYLAEKSDLPGPAEVIAGCSRRLWVCSDRDDPDFDNSDQFTHYVAELRGRFGAFIQDYVNGGWWT